MGDIIKSKPNLKKQKAKNLAEMIEQLPTPALSNDGLRELLLQFIIEVPEDNPEAAFATRAKVKLDALNLLVKLNQMDQKTSGNADMMDIITLDEGEE